MLKFLSPSHKNKLTLAPRQFGLTPHPKKKKNSERLILCSYSIINLLGRATRTFWFTIFEINETELLNYRNQMRLRLGNNHREIDTDFVSGYQFCGLSSITLVSVATT